MEAREKITFLRIALQSQGWSLDDIATEQFLETLSLIESKKGKANIEDTSIIEAKYKKIREELL